LDRHPRLASGRILFLTTNHIDLDSDSIREFCRKWHIRQLYVFGSVLREDFRPESDIDFLAEFETCPAVDDFDFFDEIHMRDEISALLGREVDIIDRSVIESASNPYIRRELLSAARPVFAK
jgi:predicted nucleotidyltransferase